MRIFFVLRQTVPKMHKKLFVKKQNCSNLLLSTLSPDVINIKKICLRIKKRKKI